MYSKHCYFIPEGGGDIIHSQKMIHLPHVGMYVKFTPKSTGEMTEYEVEKITLVMEEVTIAYDIPPGEFDDNWEYKWVIEVTEA